MLQCERQPGPARFPLPPRGRRCAGWAVAVAAVALPGAAGMAVARLTVDAWSLAASQPLLPGAALTVVAAGGCTLALAWLTLLAALAALAALREASADPGRTAGVVAHRTGPVRGAGRWLPGRRTATLAVTALVPAVLQAPGAGATTVGPPPDAPAAPADGDEVEGDQRSGAVPAAGTWASLVSRPARQSPPQSPAPALEPGPEVEAGPPAADVADDEAGLDRTPATPFVAPPLPPSAEDSALVTGSPSRPSGQPDGGEPVVVTAGDCLWSIVARQLGPDATDAEIAREWPAWWRANAAVIGDDPDLLLPGQRLVPPA